MGTKNIIGNLTVDGNLAVNDELTVNGSKVITENSSAEQLPDHAHNYAGSSSAGGSATSAVKLDTTTAGSATQPIYFTDGKPTACTYTLEKSVPSDAKFTDTTYSNATTSAAGLMSAADKTKLDGIGNGTITLVDSNGNTIGSFSLNQSSNATITIPSGSTNVVYASLGNEIY